MGEHILSLFQQLEDFAGSDALSEVSMVMSGLDRLGEIDWREPATVLGLTEAETSSLVKMVSSGEGIEGWAEVELSSGTSGSTTGGGGPDEEGDISRSGGDDSAHFCSEWLGCIAIASTGTLLARVLEIPHLSRRGSNQMSVDTSYLLNVLANLEIQPPPFLCMLNRIMGMDDDDLTKVLEDRDKKGRTATGPVTIVRKIERRLGTIRGLTLSFEAK